MNPLVDSPAIPSPTVRRRWFPLAAGLILLVLASLGLWWVWSQPAPTPVPDIALDGMDAPVVEVISRALERVRREPRSGSAWGHLGEVLGVHAQNQPALECFAEAARLDPNEPRWPYRLGLYLSILEDPEKSLPHLRRAGELLARSDPSNNVPRLLLAETLLELRQLEEAETILGEVARVEPNNARVHHDLGLLALAQNNGVAAEKHLIRALASPYAHKKACVQLARLYQQQGKATVAADFSRRAAGLPTDPPWPDPYDRESAHLDNSYQSHSQQAHRFENMGQRNELLKVLHELNRDYPGNRSTLNLGMALARMGDLEGAEANFRQALPYAELQIDAQFCLGMVLYEKGRSLWEAPKQRERARKIVLEAVDHLRTAVQRKPNYAQAHLYHGMALHLLGQPQEALKSFRLCIECRPEMVDGHLQLGKLLAEQGQRAEALLSLEQAAQLSEATDSRARQALEQVRAQKAP